MHFTREPIIETVITPREGCKLVVRSSKGVNQEEFFIDAVEVVSFGHSFFYRSLDRSKPFLVPVSDYEILELKEARMVLKSATSERSTKIGGGREAPMRPREPEREEQGASERPPEKGSERGPPDRKRDTRRRRGRRGRDRNEPQEMSSESYSEQEVVFESNEAQSEPMRQEPPAFPEEQKAPSFISKLFPPPPTLIKDTLSRYKPAEPVETTEEDLFPASSEEPVAFDEKTSFEESIYEQPPKHPGQEDTETTEE